MAEPAGADTMVPPTWLPVPEMVQVQVSIRRTISGTEGLALVNGGLEYTDRDASEASLFDMFPSTLLLVIYELYTSEYTNKIGI
jgi:hypothetical protein